MSSSPSSTGATVGSTYDALASSSTAHKSGDKSTQAHLSAQRQAVYENDATSSHPRYQHHTTDASVQAHTTAARTYLDSFDAGKEEEDISEVRSGSRNDIKLNIECPTTTPGQCCNRPENPCKIYMSWYIAPQSEAPERERSSHDSSSADERQVGGRDRNSTDGSTGLMTISFNNV
ncbi:hypothetical protein B0J14DRAFT_639210 [Halenospora varia]|nr:hypothetical protein B0J14DRAFT_639210 [Halenospora varia]